MPPIRLSVLAGLLKVCLVVLVVRILVAVLLNFPDYFPPRFDRGFLSGRTADFPGPYAWAFYAHIFAGPLSLIFGTILISESFRRRFPHRHRQLGRIQVACVLLVVAPSGLWMAFYAETGAPAGVGFALLALATGACVACGWRAAVGRRFEAHRRWMQRVYVLLFSAVVIRLLGGLVLTTGLNADWAYPVMAWASWLVPLALLETFRQHSPPPIPRESVPVALPAEHPKP